MCYRNELRVGGPHSQPLNACHIQHGMKRPIHFKLIQFVQIHCCEIENICTQQHCTISLVSQWSSEITTQKHSKIQWPDACQLHNSSFDWMGVNGTLFSFWSLWRVFCCCFFGDRAVAVNTRSKCVNNVLCPPTKIQFADVFVYCLSCSLAACVVCSVCLRQCQHVRLAQCLCLYTKCQCAMWSYECNVYLMYFYI